MKDSWKAFLEQAGARIETDRVAGFSDPATEAKAATDGDVISDLSHLAVLRIAGEDARDFLHGQFTNDLRLVTDSRSELNGYCTAKGRLLAVFRVFQHEGAYHLRLHRENSEAFLKKLRMFVLMSKVTIDDVSDEVTRVGVSGPDIEAKLRTAGLAVPGDVDETTHDGGMTVMRVPGVQPRFELYGSEAAIQDLWSQLAGSTTAVGHDAWALLDIRAGIPTVYEATTEAFVPQMVNLQAVEGVSFRKGCYPGQEIVARMQYLGQLKRRMYLAHVDAPKRPLPGDALYSPASQSGQGTGKVVDARPAPGGGFDLLAVIQIDCAEQGEVFLGESSNGPRLQLEELPYSHEAAADAPEASHP